MKKNVLLIVFAILCVGFFIPKDAMALAVGNNVVIDYRFFIEENENNEGKLKFKIHDAGNDLLLNSKYDTSKKQYYFEYDEISFRKECSNFCNYAVDNMLLEYNYRSYVPFQSALTTNFNDINDFNDFVQEKGLSTHYYFFGIYYYFYHYVPLILEEETTHEKRIVFAAFTYIRWYGYNLTQLLLVNNTQRISNDDLFSKNNSFIDNVSFIRRTSLDYSDELWEELNNGPISSPEIYNNINSPSYNYLNKSVNSDQYNLPEESLADYASSLPVFRLKSSLPDNEENDNNSVISKIINPKTWTNGIVILVISLTVIISGMFVLIRKRNM